MRQLSERPAAMYIPAGVISETLILGRKINLRYGALGNGSPPGKVVHYSISSRDLFHLPKVLPFLSLHLLFRKCLRAVRLVHVHQTASISVAVVIIVCIWFSNSVILIHWRGNGDDVFACTHHIIPPQQAHNGSEKAKSCHSKVMCVSVSVSVPMFVVC